MTYEIQHQTQHLWEAQPRWNFIARHRKLDRAVEGLNRILKPFAGQVPYTVEDWRIAEYDPKHRLTAILDRNGEVVETFTAPLFKKKVLVGA